VNSPMAFDLAEHTKVAFTKGDAELAGEPLVGPEAGGEPGPSRLDELPVDVEGTMRLVSEVGELTTRLSREPKF
jgi:predicted deacylase